MSFEDELLEDAQHDAETVAYLKSHLPQELQETFTEEQLYYFLDLSVEYLAESGVLEKEADEEGYVEIDEEKLARHLAQKAKKEDMGQFEADDLLFVVQAWLDYEMREEE